jgi:hypothetical protein
MMHVVDAATLRHCTCQRLNEERIGHSFTVSQPKIWQIRIFAPLRENKRFIFISLVEWFNCQNVKNENAKKLYWTLW